MADLYWKMKDIAYISFNNMITKFYFFVLFTFVSFYSVAQTSRSIVINDFEKSSALHTHWRTYSDSSSGGGSGISHGPINLTDHKSREYLFKYSLLKKNWAYAPYAGLLFKPGPESLPYAPVEAITYEFKGSAHAFEYMIYAVKDHSYHRKKIRRVKSGPKSQ